MPVLGDIDVTLVDRSMAEFAPPTFTEVGPLIGASGITITEPLNLPEVAQFTIPATSQEDGILARFMDPLDAFEIWIHDRVTGTRLFSGPFLGYQPQQSQAGIMWNIRASGILSYLHRWLIEPDGSDLVFTADDQSDIATGLIDYYQALAYGDYGIDTSGVSATGITRDRTYHVPEQHIIFQRLAELAAVEDGFDFSVDPETRDFMVHYPERGSDLTGTVVIDSRSIIDPQAQISVGSQDIVSEGFAVSSTGLVSRSTNATMRSKWGRTGFSSAFQNISVQATLDDHAARVAGQRDTYLHSLGLAAYPVGISWLDFEPGDLVEFHYNYGAGDLIENRRILERSLKIEGAKETIQVKLL